MNKIDDFTLLSVLGKGAYAKVILVRNNDSQKLYAIKILKLKGLKNKKDI